MKRKITLCLALFAFWLGSAAPVRAGTELNFWHSYLHQPDSVIHFSFHIANYKRGLFLGSCGPSTRSLQWGFDVDLAGPGPGYSRDQICIRADGKPVEVASGTVSITPNQQQATIALQLVQPGTNKPGTPINFPGNGTHRIQKIK